MEQPGGVAVWGLWDRYVGHQTHDRVTNPMRSGSVLERRATAGKSPVHETHRTRSPVPSNAGTVKVGVNLRGPPRKAKHKLATDSARVP